MAGKNESAITEWWLQRLTGAVVGLYVIVLIGLLLVHGTPNAGEWRALFSNNAFRVLTLLALISAFYHGLVGVLHVWPDYVKDRAVRAVLVGASWLAFIAYSAWAVVILFGLKQ